MAEVVGLALAIPGVVTPMLSLISEITTVVQNSNRFASDAKTLRDRFLDEDRLIESSMRFLFGEPPTVGGGVFKILPVNSQRGTVSMIIQLFGLLRDYTTIEDKYNITAINPNTGFDLEAFLQDNTLALDHQPGLQPSASWWRKFHWSISGKKRLESLIYDLSEWNRRLRNVIQDVVWTVSLTAPQVQIVEANADVNALGFGPSAKMRKLVVSGDSVTDSPILFSKVKNIVRGGRETFTMAEIDNHPVILEYKDYEVDNEGNIPNNTLKQVRQLTNLLHCQKDPGFRVLPCRGYINDRASSKFGFVFGVPDRALPKPITLDSALNLTSSRSKKPSVTARLKLSHKIAESLYLLHTVGWVHKSLRSESIVFFELKDNSSGDRTIYESPWILGFEYSREESDFSSSRTEDRIERNIYRHWERWGKPTARSRKIHDIYEIGLWQSAKTLSKDGFKSHSGDQMYVRDALRKAAKGRLGFSMGEKFEELVVMCLEGDEKAFGVEGKHDPMLQKEFREKVVEVLKTSSECI